MRVLSFKIALVVLCNASIESKYKCECFFYYISFFLYFSIFVFIYFFFFSFFFLSLSLCSLLVSFYLYIFFSFYSLSAFFPKDGKEAFSLQFKIEMEEGEAVSGKFFVWSLHNCGHFFPLARQLFLPGGNI